MNMTRDWMGYMKNIFALEGAWGIPQAVKAAGNASMTQVLHPAYTRRLRPDPEGAFDAEICLPKAATLSLSWYGMTDRGMVRPHNEDDFACQDFGSRSLFVVADGMGGHDAGEVASKLAVKTVCKEIGRHANRSDDPKGLVELAARLANVEVKREGELKRSNMGTTLSLALVEGSTAYIANVGDSRVYWIDNGSITQITEDHSLVAKMVSTGKMTKAEARNHPKSNLLYRTIGIDDMVRVDTFTVELEKGGCLLLCTDGLWGELTDEVIHGICSTENDSEKICAKLLRTANEKGGKDNVTAVVVKAS
jgi:serine/threonine protein phosphatase PrpC